MKNSSNLKEAEKLSGSFLCFGILSALIIATAFSFLLLKTHWQSYFSTNGLAAINLILFFSIWTTGLAILPSLPNPFPRKGLIYLLSLGVVVHFFFIYPRVIEKHDYFRAFTVFAIDLCIIATLLEILKRKKLGLRWVFLYIVNPCVLAGLQTCPPFIFAGILFFIGAVYYYISRQWKRMSFFAGVSAGLFPYSIPAALLFLNRKNINTAWIMLLGFSFSWLFAYSFSGNISEPVMKSGAFTHFIEAIFQINDAGPISLILASFFCLFGTIIFHPSLNSRYENDPFQGFFFVFATLITLIPEPPISLFIWIAPFIVFRPSIMWLLLGFSAVTYAATTGISVSFPGFSADNQIFSEMTLLKSVIWFPLYISLPFAFYRMVQHHRNADSFSWVKKIRTISVIIPTLNEASGISLCIKNIKSDASVNEIIVVDAGSNDNTAEIAEKEGATVIIHKNPIKDGGGRGGQIRAGLLKSKGDAVAVVHADSVISTPVFTSILETLNHNPDAIGGAVGCRFDSDELKFRAIEFANNARMAYLGIAFGDQIQFFRRMPVIENNAFPDIPLMEDIELSMRLKNLGTQIFLFGDVIVSTRRWQKKGFTNALWVIRQVIRYLWLRAWREPDSAALYNEYYASKGGIEG